MLRSKATLLISASRPQGINAAHLGPFHLHALLSAHGLKPTTRISGSLWNKGMKQQLCRQAPCPHG